MGYQKVQNCRDRKKQKDEKEEEKRWMTMTKSFGKVINILFWPGEGQAQIPPENRAECSASSGQDSVCPETDQQGPGPGGGLSQHHPGEAD